MPSMLSSLPFRSVVICTPQVQTNNSCPSMKAGHLLSITGKPVIMSVHGLAVSKFRKITHTGPANLLVGNIDAAQERIIFQGSQNRWTIAVGTKGSNILIAFGFCAFRCKSLGSCNARGFHRKDHIAGRAARSSSAGSAISFQADGSRLHDHIVPEPE